MEKLICALIFGEAKTSKKAEQIATSYYKNCPYTKFVATRGNQLFAALFLPQEHSWWIEYVEKNPKNTVGLEKAKVTITDNVYYPKTLKMRIPKKPQDISPCGSNCKNCPLYGKCPGCPATIFYKHSSRDL